jgi:hypothetical protein
VHIHDCDAENKEDRGRAVDLANEANTLYDSFKRSLDKSKRVQNALEARAIRSENRLKVMTETVKKFKITFAKVLEAQKKKEIKNAWLYSKGKLADQFTKTQKEALKNQEKQLKEAHQDNVKKKMALLGTKLSREYTESTAKLNLQFEKEKRMLTSKFLKLAEQNRKRLKNKHKKIVA